MNGNTIPSSEDSPDQKSCQSQEKTLPPWLLAVGLVGLILAAYHPAWHGGFIWDDNYYVSENPLLTAPDGLWRIWFSLDSPSQYFPLTYTTFYFERMGWGLNTTGYHWVNLLLHGANALLVWRLLLRLRVPGAWLAAAIFALHPVQVESVAWITERKNTLMAFFYLLSLLAWLKFIGENTKGRRPFYWFALICHGLALAAKTTACTLPFALLLILWFEKKPVNTRLLLQVTPFIALGLGMGLVTIWWERFHQGTNGQLFAISWPVRFLIAGRALWFYAGKLLWPAKLFFSYPRWHVSAADPLPYAWSGVTIVAAVLLWRNRETARRGLAVGAAFFAITLAPVLGFIMLYTFKYSFVADHYQYIACLGLVAPAAAGMARLGESIGMTRFLRAAFCCILLTVLGILTWRQCHIYTNAETLWRATLAGNPDSGMAESNLGNLLVNKGEYVEAIEHLRKGLGLSSGNAEAHYNLGNGYLGHGDLDEAIAEYREALRIQPDLPGVFKNLGLALLRHGDLNESLFYYRKTTPLSPDPVASWIKLGTDFQRYGHWKEAVACFGKTLEINPEQPGVQGNLAMLLATASDASVRNGARAVALAEKADQSAQNSNPAILRALAAALAETGQFVDAESAARKALALAQSRNDLSLTATLEADLKLYEARQPLRIGK